MIPDRIGDHTQGRAWDGGVSAWVGASAGTGKTTVLTDRVLSLLLGGCDPARILCLTFTRAAAAEMANRLNDKLALWAVVPDGALAQDLQRLVGRAPGDDDRDRARRLFARVLDTPGGMKIETIHAFCQSLLRRFPLEAGIAPHFELMDERNADEALAEARDDMLTEARIGADPALAIALAEVTSHAAESTFDDLMRALVDERARFARALSEGIGRFRQLLARRLEISPDATPAAIVAAACEFDGATLAAGARYMIERGSKRDRERGEAMARFLAAPVEGRPDLFDAYCAVFLTHEGDERKDIVTKAIATGAPEIEAALRREAERLERARRERAAASLMRATLALAALGDRMLALYRSRKDGRALLDYDDLVLGARDLLCGEGIPSWVLFKLDGGIDHILIDEAQDTNPEQWEVVAKLADEFFAGEAARPGPRTVFAVGDIKQSIFSFQRADPDFFLRMHDHFAAKAQGAGAGWRRVSLDLSFRSTSAVLAAVDAVFARPEASAGVALEGAPIRHVAHRAGQGGLVELWPAVEPVDAPPPAPWELPLEQRRASVPQLRLAQAIAATIKGWIERGERLESRDRRIVPGDVMVLVRRRTQFVGALVRALRERNVAVAGSDRMRLVDQLAVEDAMALLRFLLLPDDDLTLATVLKGPLFGFDEELLFALAWQRGDDAPLWGELQRRAGKNPDFARAATLLRELMGRADYAPPYELLAEIMGERGGRRRWLARLGPEAADALDELMAAALAYERSHGPSLQGFLHWLGAGDIVVKRDLDERGRDEVRIMTVHGAKGLQAPIVFLPDTLQVPTQPLRVVWADDGLALWAADKACGALAFDRARAAAAQRRQEEYRRLLYVAMTRAEDRLYVCGWRNKRNPSPGTWYDLVAAGLAEAEGVERFAFASPAADGWAGPGLRLSTPQTAKPVSDTRLSEAASAQIALPAWASDAPKPELIPPKPLAPSRPEGTEPAPRSPLGGDGGAGFRRGLIVHRLLQSLPQLDPAARASAARRFLARPVHALSDEAQAAILAETLAVLEEPDFAPLFGPLSLAEVPVVGLVDGSAISGRIDRLLVRDDTVLIVDYKTLRPVPASEDDIPPLYLEQLRAYRAAVAAIYPGRAVQCALLWTEGPRLMRVSDARLVRPRH
ncbi:MAG TPA: double-strand break repair helicase AddA [Stellaceae bacterium]|nr:double-strand break repair helicase AddA [Stellaceae bacterium]